MLWWFLATQVRPTLQLEPPEAARVVVPNASIISVPGEVPTLDTEAFVSTGVSAVEDMNRSMNLEDLDRATFVEDLNRSGISLKLAKRIQRKMAKIKVEEIWLREKYNAYYELKLRLENRSTLLRKRIAGLSAHRDMMAGRAWDIVNEVQSVVAADETQSYQKKDMLETLSKLRQRLEFNRDDSVQLEKDIEKVLQLTHPMPREVARLFSDFSKFASEQKLTKNVVEAVSERFNMADVSDVREVYAQISGGAHMTTVETKVVPFAFDDVVNEYRPATLHQSNAITQLWKARPKVLWALRRAKLKRAERGANSTVNVSQLHLLRKNDTEIQLY